jgi:Flp pilus assembly protein TadD
MIGVLRKAALVRGFGIVIAGGCAIPLLGCRRDGKKLDPPVVEQGTKAKSAVAAAVNSATDVVPAQRVAPVTSTVAVTADSEDAIRLKKYWSAMGRGRLATVKKNYGEALDAFSKALDLLPDDARAYAERGYAQLLAKNYQLAREDFDLAVMRTDDPKLLAQIWFNYGLTAEKEGRPEDAQSAFARSNQLNPTKAASDKLEGGSVCTARVGERSQPEPTSSGKNEGHDNVADFLTAFHQQAEGRTPEQVPATAEEARNVLCAFGDCVLAPPNGAPIRLKIGSDSIYGAVISVTNGKLRIFPKLEVSKPGPCGTEDQIKVLHQSPLHFRIVLTPMIERFEGPNHTPCVENNSDRCVRQCVKSTTKVEDWLFNTAGDDVRLLVEQWMTPGGKTPWEVSVTGTDAKILGSGCDISWDLK